MLTTAERNRDWKMVRTEGVLNKGMMKSLEAAGGWNHFRSWKTPAAFIEGGYRGWTTIRSMVRDSPYFVPEVPPGKTWETLIGLRLRGANIDDLYVQEIPDPTKIRRYINFEVQRTPQHYLVLRYGTGQINLRHDLEQNGKEVYDLEASITLRHYLGPCWDELQELLDRFPSDCIEGTRFNQRVGTLESELIIWEARSY